MARRTKLSGKPTGTPISKSAAIRHHLISELGNGRFQPGSLLPPENELAESFNVARNTVRVALAEMEQMGLVQRKHGRGTFVRDEAHNRLHRKGLVFALAVYRVKLPYFMSMLHGFEKYSSECCVQTIACSTDDDLKGQAAVILQLMHQRVDGAAIVPVASELTSANQIQQLQERGIPVVLCRRGVPGCRAPVVAVPYDKVGELAGKVLIDRGHRRLGFLASGAPSTVASAYENGLRAAMRAADLATGPVVYKVASHPPVDAEVVEVVRALVGGPNPVTAVFVSHDNLAEKVYLCAQQMGVRIPEDVSLLGFGDSSRQGALAERLSSLVVDDEEIGRLAASLLWEIHTGKRDIYDTERIAMPLALSEGQTLGPASVADQQSCGAYSICPPPEELAAKQPAMAKEKPSDAGGVDLVDVCSSADP